VSYLTVTEYAAICREHCQHPAQGDGALPCGGEVQTEEGETVYGFCGWHWVAAALPGWGGAS
jgi:hypothetical protein